jgi:ATP-dependent DNA ligase
MCHLQCRLTFTAWLQCSQCQLTFIPLFHTSEAGRRTQSARGHSPIDGNGLGVDGISDFNALHSGRHSEEVQLCAFDVLAMDGDDLRRLPLSMRKANLARLLRGRPEGIFINPFEHGEIGPDLFLKACEFGLEGLVSKHRDRPYQAGRSTHWVKVKNQSHPAFDRVQEAHRR